MLEDVASCEWVTATQAIEHCASVKTPGEVVRIQRAAKVGLDVLNAAGAGLSVGLREVDVAGRASAQLQAAAMGQPEVKRAHGFAYCMSGPNASRAFAAYQISSGRLLQDDELVLLHVNSTVDGFWTDLTRTHSLGSSELHTRVLGSIRDAREAALQTVRPGATGSEVDGAARKVLEQAGFGKAFKHALGHGVGFSAFDHNASPILAPFSDHVLEPGMVFNLEPGVYLDDLLGARHCDMVLVTDSGFEVLSA